MTSSEPQPVFASAETRRLSLPVLLHSVPYVVAGLVVTFSVDHSPLVGLIGLLILSFGTAVTRIVLGVSGRTLGRVWLLAHGADAVVSLTVFVMALAVVVNSQATQNALTALVGLWAGASALSDVALLMGAPVPALRRDFRFLALTAIALAVVETVIPLSSIYATGLLGAFAIVTGVYLAIAGASLRFDSTNTPTQRKKTR